MFTPVQKTPGGLWLVRPRGGAADQKVRYYDLPITVNAVRTETMRKCYEAEYTSEYVQTLSFPDGKCLGVDLNVHGLMMFIDDVVCGMTCVDYVGKLTLACDCASGLGNGLSLEFWGYDQCDEFIQITTLVHIGGTAAGNPDLPTVRAYLQSGGMGGHNPDRPVYLKTIQVHSRCNKYAGGTIDLYGTLVFQGIW